MKRFIAALLCLGLVAVASAGCSYKDALANNTTTTQAEDTSSKIATEDEVKPSDFEDNLNGICEYFAKLGYITLKDGKIDESLVTEMDASLVGAKAGKKFKTNAEGKPVTIELYEYDVNNLNDTAKAVVDSVKKDGVFSILGFPEVRAYLSDDGKYMMIYTDESIDDANPDKESGNYKHREEVIEAFKKF